jgi:hypothetical protein
MRNTKNIDRWTILGMVAAAAVVAGIAMNFGDLRRYIKLELM